MLMETIIKIENIKNKLYLHIKVNKQFNYLVFLCDFMNLSELAYFCM